MNIEELLAIRAKLKENLKPERYEHTLGVAFTSAALAMRYGADIRKAELAGLLHDCAKNYKTEELISMCKAAGIELTENELQAPQVLHAIYAPVLAREAYEIEDEEVLSALRWHTTGHANMTLLEKIVYIADYIEPRREKADNLAQVRGMAFLDIDATLYRITVDTIEFLKKRGVWIDRFTVECFEWLEKEGINDQRDFRSNL